MPLDALGGPEPRDDSDLAEFGLESPDDTWLERVRSAARPRSPGRAGEYELIEEVGRGAQGVVYRAREPSTKREVALKRLIAGSWATSAMRARFEREVEAAAALQHPNVVTVFGVHYADGQPLLAMEWIEGVPVDRWSAECPGAAGRSAESTLRLFVKICDAVHHAHQRGVIHRDLKPSNILVDRAGEPHVLDFGLAKLTPLDGSSGGGLTLTRDFAGTPAYASPEHVCRGPQAVDVRSDVYALGVILYQALTGTLPYAAHGSLAELLYAVQHAQPPKPSSIRPQLDRELDAILLKALAKEPQRRYPSVEALCADLRRYLSGEPVLAHPPTALYQIRKLVRRHRLPFALAAALAGVVIAFAITAGVLAVRLADERTAALAARDDEAQARASAERINAFLQDMLAAPDPLRLGPQASMREVLDEAARSLSEGALDDQPRVEAAVRATLGNTYRALGLYPESEPHLRLALELRERAFVEEGGDELEVAQSENDLARLLNRRGDHPPAEALLEQALERRRRLLGDGHLAVGGNLNDLGMQLHARGENDTAETLLREAVDVLRPAPESAELLATSLKNLGEVQQARGDLAGAEASLREALALRRSLHGPEHLEIGRVTSSLALLLQAKGDFAATAPMLEEALRIHRNTLGDEHQDTVRTLVNLAVMHQSRGDADRAEPLLLEALAIRRKTLGDQHPEVAFALNSLAAVMKARGDLEGGERAYREALDIVRASFSDEHPHVARMLNNLAALLYSKEDYAGAEEMYRQIMDIRRRTLAAGHPDLAVSLNNLAVVLTEAGGFAEAESLLREALAIQRGKLPADHPTLASTLVNLGSALLELERGAEAEPYLLEGIEIRRKTMPETHWLIANSKTLLGACLAARGACDQAERMLLAGFEAMQSDPQAPAKRKRAAAQRMARMYETCGQTEQSAAWRERL